MNIKEAYKRGISRVTKTAWSDGTYLKINLVDDGYGPWVHLYDRPTQEACGFEIPQSILSWKVKDNDFTTYEGPLDRGDEARRG
jgi:hypothetical protein